MIGLFFGDSDFPIKILNKIKKCKKKYFIIDLSKNGTSIILITSDMPEMIGLADRIITMKDFKEVGETLNNHNYDDMSASIMANIHE